MFLGFGGSHSADVGVGPGGGGGGVYCGLSKNLFGWVLGSKVLGWV